MTLWRISEHAALDGGGGLSFSARWHTAGRRIVYCAPNPATALLEVLVHTEIRIENVPVSFRYLRSRRRIRWPSKTSIRTGWANHGEPTWG